MRPRKVKAGSLGRKKVHIAAEARLLSKRDYDEELREVVRLLERQPDNVDLLLRKAAFIQLSEDPPFTLADAKAALVRAMELRPERPDVLADMAFYLYAVDDDAKAALPLFMKAEAAYEKGLWEVLEGYEDCLRELGREDDANYLEQRSLKLKGP